LSQLDLAEDLSAEKVPGDHPRQSVETHDLRVPHAHHVERAGMLGVGIERVERLLADYASVLDSVTRTHGESVAANGPRELEVAFGIARVCRDRATCVLFCILVQCLPPVFARVELTAVDGSPRGSHEPVVAVRIRDGLTVCQAARGQAHGNQHRNHLHA
jgi:hypothetical protein